MKQVHKQIQYVLVALLLLALINGAMYFQNLEFIIILPIWILLNITVQILLCIIDFIRYRSRSVYKWCLLIHILNLLSLIALTLGNSAFLVFQDVFIAILYGGILISIPHYLFLTFRKEENEFIPFNHTIFDL